MINNIDKSGQKIYGKLGYIFMINQDNQFLSKEEFVNIFSEYSGIDKDELLKKGVFESSDFINENELMERRNAARIIHLFVRDIKGVKDEPDISESYIIKDLFDCRICANHIAQVYLKGIIEARNIDDLIIFDTYGRVSMEDFNLWIKRIDMVDSGD